MEYKQIPSSKFDEVIELLRHSFPDEPLNSAVGLSFKGQPCELLEKYNLMSLKEGLSIMAIDSATGLIAGVILNGVSKRGDVEESLEAMKSIDNIPYQRIFGLLNNANKELDLFTMYNVESIFELRILTVDSRFRGRGVAKELFVRSELIAKKTGNSILKVDATSMFTQKICESQGYKVIKSIRYREFKDDNGSMIYATESPHDFYKIMVKQLF